jgi:hypothetical protein
MRESAYVVSRLRDGPDENGFIIGVAASLALAEDVIAEYCAAPTKWVDTVYPPRPDRFSVVAFDFRRVRTT